ncbi:hypothetical protein Trisim1_006514 [Trichoderma cf. simile WF8]
MGDQPPSSARLGDTQGQPREDKSREDRPLEDRPREDRPALGRWLAQQPREDNVPFTFEWRETQEILTEETRSEEQAKDDDISFDCLRHVSGCQATDENRIPPCDHQNTKGDSDQPSSGAHNASQSETVFAHQQQEHLSHVLFSSPGQEALEQPFNQAFVPSGLLDTADSSGTSDGAIQQNIEVDQWLGIPDTTLIREITNDRRRALLQLCGKVHQELSTIDSTSGSHQPVVTEHPVFKANLYSSHGYAVDGMSLSHTTESFSRLDTNHPKSCTSPHYPGLVPSHFSTNLSPTEPLRYGCTTTPGYSSDTHSRDMDEVSSEMTFSTNPTTNMSLNRNNFWRFNLEPAQALHSNMVNECAYFFII